MSRSKRKGFRRMSRKPRSAAQRYHDRVAGRYDGIYDDAYWAWHDRLTWEHLRAHLPRNLSAKTLDLGCGTGKWGPKLLEAGYAVTFVDLSAEMLDQVRAKIAGASFERRAAFVHADLMNLADLPDAGFAFAAAMGEPIGCAESPSAALAQIHRKLAPDGMLVATFDNRLACVDHYLARGDADAAAELLRTGRTRWLTRDAEEQFIVHTYTPTQLRLLLERAGFAYVDLIGKTVLPMRAHRELLADPQAARHWAELEKGLHRIEAALGRCAHLQVAARVA